MYASSIIHRCFINSVILLCFLQVSHSQAPNLTLTFMSSGCFVDDVGMVLAEGTADFTGRDSISVWSSAVSFAASNTVICRISLDPCPSPESDCYCENTVNQEYRLVMNRTTEEALSGRNITISASSFTVMPILQEHSDPLQYPVLVDPVLETGTANSSTFNISRGIIPSDVTSINYTVTGLQEPYNIMYNVSEPITSNTTSVIVNFSTSQRIISIGYEELGPTCFRHKTHTLCRKDGIEETLMFDGNIVLPGSVLPDNVVHLDYTLSGMIEPYFVKFTITYDTLPQVNQTYDNRSNIQLAINGSREICISYEETGTARLSECLGQGENCYSITVPTTVHPTTGPSCPCDCDDWKEPYTVVLFIAMLIQLICGVVVLVLYCFREKFPLWPIVTLVLSFVMVATVACTIGFMCYQEIDDCGLCDCQYTFILIEMIVTLLVIFFIMIILYKEGGEYFKQKWFRSLLLLLAVGMAAFSIIGIVVVFCDKEISGSGTESWHIIYLLIGIAMAAIVVIGILALFVCQSGQIKHDDDSRNGKMLKKEPKAEHVELSGKTDGGDGKPNPAYTDQVDSGQPNQSHGDSGTNADHSPRRLPPLQDNKDFNSIPPSSISSRDTNQDTTEVRKLKKKKKKKGDSEKVQLSQDSVTSKESTDVSSPRRHSNSKIHPEESLGLKSAGRPLPSPRSHLPPLKV